ncbi:MAG: hypothetical protein H7240_00870 [Glaciimonas sp.]|nr:hypothetical protein [Glaciimonas sp.]
MDRGWRRNVERRKEAVKVTSAQKQADSALLEKIERTFNPFVDPIQKFINTALTLLFESKGLSGAERHQLIAASYRDQRPAMYLMLNCNLPKQKPSPITPTGQ